MTPKHKTRILSPSADKPTPTEWWVECTCGMRTGSNLYLEEARREHRIHIWAHEMSENYP